VVKSFSSCYGLLMEQRWALFLAVFLIFSTAANSKDKYQTPRPIHLDHDGEKWAEKSLKHLSLEEKVGQLFMIAVRAEFLNVDSPLYLQLRSNITRYHLGSVLLTVSYEPPILYRSEPFEAAELLNRLQQDSKLPLLVAADFERGIDMRLRGGTDFPHAMAFGADGRLDHAEDFGRITGEESRAIGVQWNFFPVVDVNSNPANPVINTRSFGEDPRQVSDLADAYIRGAHASGLLTTAKHFPGHGETAADSHLGVAQVTGNLQRLNTVELPPFRQAIAAGVDSVMIAHVSVPALEPDPNRVASTSPLVVNELLKKQLGFKGLVVTDALDMAALTRLYASDIGRAAVDAFKAGNDVLIIPANLDASYDSMLAAVRSGEIPESRLDASVIKILQAKASLGLQNARLVDLTKLTSLIGQPKNLTLSQEIANDAITLIRDNGKVLPLKKSGTTGPRLPYQPMAEVQNRLVVLIFSDDVRTEAGHQLERQIKLRVPDAHVIYLDPRFAAAMTDTVLNAVDQSETVAAVVYAVPVPGKPAEAGGASNSSAEVGDASGRLLRQILDHAAAKTAVVAMGNPYLAANFSPVDTYVCAFSTEPVSEIAAVRALFGEIPIHGHLPVSILNIASRGAGIERPSIQQGGVFNANPTRPGR
jgi:beta-N-acetylhexosaminidase